MDKMRTEFQKWYNRRFANGSPDPEAIQHGQEDMFEAYQAATAEAEKYREVLEIFTRAAYPVLKEINARGYNWSEAYLDEALIIAKQALQK